MKRKLFMLLAVRIEKRPFNACVLWLHLLPDPAAKKLFFALAVKLNDKDCDRWYRCFFYNMRVEMERFAHHKYVPDSYPVPIMEGLYE